MPMVAPVSNWQWPLPAPGRPLVASPPQQSVSCLQRSPVTWQPLAGWQIEMPETGSQVILRAAGILTGMIVSVAGSMSITLGKRSHSQVVTFANEVPPARQKPPSW